MHLDVAALAATGDALQGQWRLSDLERLVPALHEPTADVLARHVDWQVRGELRRAHGRGEQVWLHVEAQAVVELQCQRCLGGLTQSIQVQRSFLFVEGEGLAAELDADSEDDVLALTNSLDLRELVEDELLLALPLVPRHDACPAPLTIPNAEAVPIEQDNPFAVLESLKHRRGKLN